MSENAFIHKEAFWLLADKLIGQGTGRRVYSSSLLPHVVIKCEEDAGSFQNIAEWQLWQAVKDTEWARWFAPCVRISGCGSVLIQERTVPAVRYPEQLPVFLTDTKKGNYGMLGNRFVCHDYGLHTMFEFGMVNRTRKVRWREE